MTATAPRFLLTVEPHGSLYVGGYAQARGDSDGDTAADAEGLLLPGSAVKGALRESALRLVRGAGRGKELVQRLFGSEDQAGLLRFSTLRPEAPAEPPSVPPRFHVSLERATRQAAPKRLFQNHVTPAGWGLRFRGELSAREPLTEQERGLLSTAAQITDQVGGGRGRGLGLVTVELVEAPLPTDTEDLKLPSEVSSLLLVLECEEALHLAAVKDPSNYVESVEHLDGSSIRGAVAAALALEASGEELETLLGGDAPAVFGDGLAGHPTAVPAPATLLEPKGGGSAVDEAALLGAQTLGGRPHRQNPDLRRTTGTWISVPSGWSRFTPMRRTVTRTARDAASGRAADGQLFSLEVVDPLQDSPHHQPSRRLRFHVPVQGSPEQLALAIRAARRGLVVGGDRSRGFGRLRLVEVLTEPLLEPLAERHLRWVEHLASLGVERPKPTGVLLALGPLALDQRRLLEALADRDLRLVEGAARRRPYGGWNGAMHLPRTVTGAFLPGSTFVVVEVHGKSALPALEALESQGLGPGRPDGRGRLVACHPIHIDCK